MVLVGVSLFFGRSLADELMFSTLSHQRGCWDADECRCVIVFGILTESNMLVHEYCHSWPGARVRRGPASMFIVSILIYSYIFARYDALLLPLPLLVPIPLESGPCISTQKLTYALIFHRQYYQYESEKYGPRTHVLPCPALQFTHVRSRSLHCSGNISPSIRNGR